MATTTTASTIAKRLRDLGYVVRVTNGRVVVKVQMELAGHWMVETGAKTGLQATDAVIGGILKAAGADPDRVAAEPIWTRSCWTIALYPQY